MSAISFVKNKAITDFEFGVRAATSEELAKYLEHNNIQPNNELFKVYTETYEEQVDFASEWAAAYANVIS